MKDLDSLLDGESAADDATSERSALFRVDGVGFAIAHGNAPADVLTVYCNFGTLAEPDSGRLLQLLKANLFLASSCAGSYGIEPESGSILYMFHAPLPGLTAIDLHKALRHAAAQAMAWRQDQTPQ
ncbi:MAG: CesT family type III secretion system chaperone [Pseudomonadota bacterium]